MHLYKYARAINVPKDGALPSRSKTLKLFSCLVVLTASMFSPMAIAGPPASIGPDEQLFHQFDRGPSGPSASWKVRLHADNDACVNPSLGCFYFQQQTDSSWALYSAVSMDVSTQHPDNACHLAAPAEPGSYRLMALNTSKSCVLRVMFRTDE
jgi:hypothetical protein